MLAPCILILAHEELIKQVANEGLYTIKRKN
jgi:hypothetical protein